METYKTIELVFVIILSALLIISFAEVIKSELKESKANKFLKTDFSKLMYDEAVKQGKFYLTVKGLKYKVGVTGLVYNNYNN